MPTREPRTTWLSPEEHAYPRGGQTRKGAAIFPDGKIRTVYAGIPDTFFSVPAHARVNGWYASGFLTYAENGVDSSGQFTVSKMDWFFHFNVMQGRKKTIPAVNVFPGMYPNQKETT